MKVLLLCVAAYACTLTAIAQQRATAPSNEVHQLFLQDQDDRKDRVAIDWTKVSPRDKARRERVQQLISAGQINTGEDFHDAAFIFQHGETPDDYLLAHILAIAGMQRGSVTCRWIAAATLDRYLQSIKQPQVFGTQYFQLKSEPLTQEPYNPEMIPESLRAQFCVHDRESQRKTAEALKTSGPMPKGNPLPAECIQQ